VARLVIVYHDPGRSEGHMVIRELGALAGEALGVEWTATPISAVEEGSSPIGRGDVVAALIPFRGGHWASVKAAAEAVGAKAYRIPVEVAARGAAERLKSMKCRGVAVLYWPAKRFAGEQARDVARLRRLLERVVGAPTVEAPVGRLRCGDCTLAATMLPGRLTGFVEERCGGRGVGYLLEPPRPPRGSRAWPRRG